MRAISRYPCRRKAADAGRALIVVAMLHSPFVVAQDKAVIVAPADAGAMEEMLLQVDVNQQQLDEVVPLLRGAGDEVYATAEELARWRLRIPDAAPLKQHGQAYYRLHAISGLVYALDLSRQTLSVTAPADAFAGTTFDEAVQIPRAARPAPGAFLNADLLAQRSGGRSTHGGVLEFGLFNPYGVAIGEVLSTETAGRQTRTRLGTTWTSDFPERLTSIRIGDAISRPGMWGRSLRFGGVQLATNFAVQPGLVTMPMQGVSGQAALPSTVDVYVNNALASSREVAPGPFSITNVPVVTGQGNVRVVVRDVLGREQVITQPFFASAALLAPGRHDYSYEAGALRRRFGVASNDYGDGFASATHRIGLNNALTGEMRVELADQLRVAGIGGVWLVPAIGKINGALARSSGKGSGLLGVLGLERSSGDWAAGLRLQASTARYAALGVDASAPMARLQASANVGLALAGNSALGLAGVLSDVRGLDRTRIVSASYSRQAGDRGFLSFSLSRSFGAAGATAAAVSWSYPLGERVTAMASVTRQSGQQDAMLLVQQGLPAGEGIGYALQAGLGGQRRLGVAAQNTVGSATFDAVSNRGETGERISLSGGVAFLDGFHASRRITDSFAVVSLPELPNVRVYADNQPAGSTDAAGRVLLPRLRAYERNAVSIEPMDLPFDTRVDSLSMEAVPAYRSGMLLRFPVRRERGATLRLRLDDGSPMPAGAAVNIEGRSQSFPVGHGGVVYMTGLSESNLLRAVWRGQACTLALAYPASRQEPLPHLGEYQCAGVRP